jgi:hypothetical protein
MINRPVLNSAVSFLVLGLVPALADTQIIPQVADGAGWSTTLVLANKTSSTQSATLSFNMDTSNGATTLWTPSFVESVSLSSISLPAGSTLFLHTPGTSGTLSQGWGQVDAATGVTAYAIFTQRVPGKPAQDGTAPAVSASSRILVPFDNTSGLVSAFAVANPNNTAETVQTNVQTSDGTTSGTLATLPAKGQMTFLPNAIPGTAGRSGLAEFYVASGSIAIIALRANGIAFTAAPVYLQTGNPIIGAPNSPQVPAPQTQVIPQVADGQGWATTIVLTNTSTGDLPFTLNFKQAVANGAGVTTPWSPPFQDTSALGVNIPAGSSIFLRTPGNAAALSQGWAELVADPRVTGYAIFTELSAKGLKQDSTAPAVSASSRILVPFDNTPGLIMALALVNPNASAETVSVNFRTSDGTVSTDTVPALPSQLPPQGQITFLMPSQFPETANKSGLAEFYVSSGTISLIALRANGTAITSAPVFFETGSPIITTGGGGGDGGGGGGGTGNIVAGGFTVAQVTVTIPSTGTTMSETIGGGFSSYTQAEWQVPFSAPTFGPCSVLDLGANLGPDTYLDAGTITVSGPNLPSGTIVPKSPAQASYDFMAATGTTLANGGTYTITGSGGTQVGPFTASTTLPQSFAVTNWDAITGINRANGVTVNWSGTGFNTVVIAATGQSFTPAKTTTVSCVVAGSLGTFSIPQGALAMLFPTQIATLTVTATTVTPGTAGGGLRTTVQTLVPNLVGGGQVNYGAIGGQISVLKSLSIQ